MQTITRLPVSWSWPLIFAPVICPVVLRQRYLVIWKSFLLNADSPLVPFVIYGFLVYMYSIIEYLGYCYPTLAEPTMQPSFDFFLKELTNFCLTVLYNFLKQDGKYGNM